MSQPVLIDAGPLVALLQEREQHHAWAAEQARDLPVPLLSCEAVLAEACYLLRKLPKGPERVLEMLERGALQVPFELQRESKAVRGLLHRYADQPMSLADACLVRMCELRPRARVFTLDAHFRIYRKNRRQVIPVIMPDP
jgi:uncharacterized protein